MAVNPRRLVLRALARLQRTPGAFSQSILRQILDGPDARMLEQRDKALVTECYYGVLRWRLRLDAVINRTASKGLPSDPELGNLLRLGVFQLLYLERVPARAAIHTSVEMAKKLRGPSIGRFVNGVLRAVDRNRSEPTGIAEKWAHPQWLVDRLFNELNDYDSVEARLRANMATPPLTVRCHPSTPTPENGVQSTECSSVWTVSNPDYMNGIRAGKWLPQDVASARVVEFLDPQPGDRILDLCAGRGVKTSQLADAVGMQGSIVAVDASVDRLAEGQRLLSRWATDVAVQFIAADASKPLPLSPNQRFDRILIDAPCTGLGVIRRRPEILWRRQPSDIVSMAALQKQILAQALHWLADDGVCVYAVCTTTEEETQGVVDGHKVSEHFVTSPEIDQSDGFYAARLSL